jgi:hypothetical protein
MRSELTSEAARTCGRADSRDVVVVVVVTATMMKAKERSNGSSEGCQKYRRKARENEMLALRNVRVLWKARQKKVQTVVKSYNTCCHCGLSNALGLGA